MKRFHGVGEEARLWSVPATVFFAAAKQEIFTEREAFVDVCETAADQGSAETGQGA